MPIYDYRCDHCGHAFSAVQSYSDVALEVCPNCGKKPRRLIVAPAVVFKGSGWYKTDSRGAAPKEGDTSAVKKDGESAPAKKEETKKSDAPASSSSASPKSEASS